MMYYEIGQYLSKKVNAGEYGEGVISKIANKIKEQYPTLNGFSKRNLYLMIQFDSGILILTKKGKITFTNLGNIL